VQPAGSSCALPDGVLGFLAQSAAASDPPPTISLITSDAMGSMIDLQQGGSYAACPAGVVPTPWALCEPGATAEDPVEGDLTALVSLPVC
jgi:hypothetical protein